MQIFKTSRSKENILSKVRKALAGHPVPMPFPDVDKESGTQIFSGTGQPDEELFAENFIRLGGKFVFCSNEQELLEGIVTLYENLGWHKLFCSDQRLMQLFQNNKINVVLPVNIREEDAAACITSCEMLLARTGSIMFSSRQYMGRTASIYYPVHIVVAYAGQVAADFDDTMARLRKKYKNDLPSMINLTTGPSRTADIEKTLVTGVHGPGEIFCFFVNA